jgi:NADPH2:quinone reductase
MEEVTRLTDGRGVQVVFDSTGADTYPDSLTSLTTHGVYAYYCGADGEPDPIPLAELPKSILVTHPVVMDHVATRPDLLLRAGQLFDTSRTTVGKLLLHPSRAL